MIGKEAKFPLQQCPLHAFCIKGGVLKHKEITRYIVSPGRNAPIYKFMDGGSMKSKDSAQLDRALNGYVYTFDPDPKRALELFKSRAESDMIRARTMLQTACSDMDKAVTAMAALGQDDTERR